MPSIFDPLLEEGLTSLALRHDWRTGKTFAVASREWDPAREFSAYGRVFDVETQTSDASALDAQATLALYERHGAGAALARVFELLAAGRHQGVDAWVHRDGALRVLSNMHSNELGIANRRHALRAGGIRRHSPDEPEESVIVDGLNLSRAMSFKNAAAQIPYGGSKICVISAPIALDDLEALGFLAWSIDRSRCFTGPDMGLLPEHADVLRRHFTRNIVGGPCGALGPTGGPTADGVLLAIEEACQAHLGEGLHGRSIAVQGLGAVGAPLARGLLAAGAARLLIADSNSDPIERFVESLDANTRARVEVVTPDEVLFSDVDVVSPNACGALFGQDEIERLRCRILMGAANNQLRAVSQDEELALAEALAQRGVLYQADWMHNAAGVIAGHEEWLHQERASADRVTAHVARVCRDGVRQNLAEAAHEGLTPTAMAYRRIESQIYPT